MARPPFQPTDELRRRVSVAAGGGMSHEEIAIGLGIDRKTLEKHFEAELSEGAYARRMEVLDAMHAAAMKANVTAQRAYLERAPQLAPAPVPKPDGDAKQPKLGKKEAADEAAKTAERGTGWDSILKPTRVQ